MRKHASQVKRMTRKRVSHLVPARPTPDTSAAETLTSLLTHKHRQVRNKDQHPACGWNRLGEARTWLWRKAA